MGPYAKFWHEFSYDMKNLMGDFSVWLSRLSEAEQLLGLCLFILVLFFLVVRRPNEQKQSGAMGRQFAMALLIVTIFGFGIGWLIDDGAANVLQRLI